MSATIEAIRQVLSLAEEADANAAAVIDLRKVIQNQSDAIGKYSEVVTAKSQEIQRLNRVINADRDMICIQHGQIQTLKARKGKKLGR